MEEQIKPKKEVGNALAVETFTDDMVRVIEDSQGGLIKKIIQEQEKHEIEKKNFSPQSKRNKTFVFVSLVLILLAVSLLALLYFVKRNETISASSTALQLTPIIYTDKVKLQAIDGQTNEQIASNISKEVNEADFKTGEIEGIYETENGKIVGLRRFILLLKSNFILGSTTLVNDNFLMGTVNKDTKNFFMLLQARSFIDIFPAMRIWENKMFSDLHGLFGVDINSTTSDLLTKNFEDGIIENKNARILYDGNGNIALMYVFLDEQSFIIAQNRNVVNEVMLRLASSQIKK